MTTDPARGVAGRSATIAVVVVVLALIGLLVPIVGPTPPAAASTVCFDADVPDPDVLPAMGSYWLFGTNSVRGNVPVLWSRDACGWSYLGDALPRLGSWARAGRTWAPAAVQIAPSSYVLYYSATDAASGRQCIGRATSTWPAGPYTDWWASPLICPVGDGGAIDPRVFTDHTGARYLLHKNDGNCCGRPVWLRSVRLSPDGRSLAGPVHNLLRADAAWEYAWSSPVIERPSMLRWAGTYHLFYAGGPYDSSRYATGRATCSGPLGPCAKVTSRSPWFTGAGPGGISLVQVVDGIWRAAFHAWRGAIGYAAGGYRAVHSRALVWTSAGPQLVAHEPMGSVDVVRAATDGTVRVAGWALDPDVVAPVRLLISVDGVFNRAPLADVPRPDVAAVYPDFGISRGFDVDLGPLVHGQRQVCVAAENLDLGAPLSLLGCRSVWVNRAPIGNLESVVAGVDGAVRVTGWALDPDVVDPVGVHVYVDGRWGGAYVADAPRADVAAAYPAWGAQRGIDLGLGALAHGRREVCVYAINAGSGGGSNPLLGCRSVWVNRAPIGNLESVVAGVDGAVRVTGWALDPDVVDPVGVHVYVDGRWGGAYVADAPRADVAAAYPAWGAQRGIDLDLVLDGGWRQVCVYAINLGTTGGSNPLLGCRTVQVVTAPGG